VIKNNTPITIQLTNYGISKNYYKNSIILPELELSNLKKWFYSQRELNEKPYITADQILKLISEKVSFESLAKTYSLDSSTRVFSGDLGQVNLDELLPEIAVEIKSMNVGDIKIVTSRYGLHIIKLEDKPGEDKYHLRQIFLNGEDFFSWQNTETKKYIIKKFINF
jgi:parvulin-like peptidyl-prolyl isomerase